MILLADGKGVDHLIRCCTFKLLGSQYFVDCAGASKEGRLSW